MYLTDRIKQTVQKVYHTAKDYATCQDLIQQYQDQLNQSTIHGLFPHNSKFKPEEHYKK
tara:strand:+ start:3103 stop:3279 length:177 start_codon:yes stop_codon:yes gene_type:complete